MKYCFLSILLGMALLCHAQKLHRHEVAIGYYGSSFLDETPFRLQNLSTNKRLPTITYTYRWNKRFDISILRGIHDFGYVKELSPGVLPPNTIFGRTIRHYSIHGGIRIPLKKTGFRLFTGLSYRTGFKGKHLYLYNHGNWIEGYDEYYDYSNMGISSGTNFQHPIFGRLFGELSVNYIRYFSYFDQNLLMPGYRIGFRF